MNIMPILSEIIVALCLFIGYRQTTPAVNNHNESYLFQHWVSSREENDTKQSYKVYRPVGYAFPPSRGREGFEIKEKGTYISRPIGPADVNGYVEEKWSLKDDELTVTNEQKEERRFKIIALSREKLVLQPLPVK